MLVIVPCLVDSVKESRGRMKSLVLIIMFGFVSLVFQPFSGYKKAAAKDSVVVGMRLEPPGLDPTTGAVSGIGTGTGVQGFQPFFDQAAAYSGPQAFQQFMSPYQQQVMDATLQEFDLQAHQFCPLNF